MKHLKAMPVRLAALLCLAAALPPAPGLCADAAASTAPAAGYNVIVVVVDCLRADHVSAYGYGRNTTPNLDALAGEAVLFRQAVAQAPTTLLSFSSIYTSRYVSAHGVDALNKALGESALTLAEILKIYNYRTASFAGGPNLSPLFKLDQGFDTYFHLNYTSSSFKTTLPAALDWAKERSAKGEKFFIMAHGNDLHTPYVFPASGLFDKGFKVNRKINTLRAMEAQLFPVYKRKLLLKTTRETITLTDDDVNHIVARYDEGIRYSDALIGEFIAGLRAAGLLDRTALIVTSDHGEGLFDHDYFFHDFNLYDNTLWVPLIIKAPGVEKREVSRQVQLIDLMPTVLELAGIAPNSDAQGHSLLPLLSGKEEYAGPGYTFGESGVGSKALRSEKWKLIISPKKTELYDLKADPGEKKNLAETEKTAAEELRAKLAEGLAAGEKDAYSEALPAGTLFRENMTKADEAQRQFFRMTPNMDRGRPR